MFLIIISIILSIVSFIAIYTVIKTNYRKARIGNRVGMRPWLGFLWLLLIFTGMFTTIDKNTVGIVYDELHGGLQEKTLGEGLHLKSPFQKITKIETINKTHLITVAGQTKDSIYADFMITIIYRIDTDNAGLFFQRTNSGDIDESQLNSIVRETLQSVSISYNIYDILGEELENVRQDFTDQLTISMDDRYHITIVSASFDDVDAGERIEESIRAKGEALQQIEIEKLNKEKADIEKEILMVEAEAQAEVVRIAAQAQADKIEFEKRALANMIAEYKTNFPTLTEKEVAAIVLQTVFYETWDGVLPEVVTGDSLEALIGSLLTNETDSTNP